MQNIKEIACIIITAVFFAAAVYGWSIGCGETYVDSTGETRLKESDQGDWCGR